MSFSVLKYRESLTERLRAVEPTHRRIFAVWCLNEIWRLYRREHREDASSDELAFIDNAVEEFEKHALAGTAPSGEYLSEIGGRCGRVDVFQDGSLQSILLVQLLGGIIAVVSVFLENDPRQAMMAAEAVINCLDASASEKHGISPRGDITEVPEIAHEIAIQEKFVSFLQQSPTPMRADLRRYRAA